MLLLISRKDKHREAVIVYGCRCANLAMLTHTGLASRTHGRRQTRWRCARRARALAPRTRSSLWYVSDLYAALHTLVIHAIIYHRCRCHCDVLHTALLVMCKRAEYARAPTPSLCLSEAVLLTYRSSLCKRNPR
jgi:hypothetical protein